MYVHFFACPKKRTKEKASSVSCPACGGMPCAPRCCRGFANSAFASDSANPLFGSLSGARLRANGKLPSPPFVLPSLAGEGGKRCGNCLRAKPEFFRVPPSSRSKGSPQGQDWLGCLFLVSSFGHAKEEKELVGRVEQSETRHDITPHSFPIFLSKSISLSALQSEG